MKCRHTGIERFPVFGEPTGVVIEDEKVDEPKGDETETETEEAPKAPTQKPAGSTGRRR